jgi:hypothetical protein
MEGRSGYPQITPIYTDWDCDTRRGRSGVGRSRFGLGLEPAGGGLNMFHMQGLLLLK